MHVPVHVNQPLPSLPGLFRGLSGTADAQKSPLGALQTGQSRTVAKSIHVHKQVVQRKAEKNTPKINPFGMRWLDCK